MIDEPLDFGHVIGANEVVRVTTGQEEVDGVAECIDQGMDLLGPPRDRPIAWSPSFFSRRHCVGGRAQWCCRSSRIHCRRRRRDAEPTLAEHLDEDKHKAMAGLVGCIKQLSESNNYDVRLEIASLLKQVVSELNLANAGSQRCVPDPVHSFVGTMPSGFLKSSRRTDLNSSEYQFPEIARFEQASLMFAECIRSDGPAPGGTIQRRAKRTARPSRCIIWPRDPTR
jgi:hypothetical protein